MMVKYARLIFFLIIAISIIQLLFYYPDLPDKVAIHFGISGEPDSWSSKGEYLAIHLGLFAFLTLIFAGFAELIDKVPASLFNIPHKKYWLSKDREKYTRSKVESFLYWTGAITLLLILIMNQKVIMFNFDESVSATNDFWAILLGYLLVLGLLIYVHFREFYQSPS